MKANVVLTIYVNPNYQLDWVEKCLGSESADSQAMSMRALQGRGAGPDSGGGWNGSRFCKWNQRGQTKRSQHCHSLSPSWSPQGDLCVLNILLNGPKFAKLYQGEYFCP